MNAFSQHRPTRFKHGNLDVRSSTRTAGNRTNGKPTAAYRQRISQTKSARGTFTAPEQWHEPTGSSGIRYCVEPAGAGYVHPVTVQEVKARLALLPERFVQNLEVVQFSRMTRKRRTFPCYGMQWGRAVYLYPIEESLAEAYVTPPKPAQQIEARMFGAKWTKDGSLWTLNWSIESIKDFYLNNVLIHEVGHINDEKHTRFQDRERFANWFAIEYGYRASRG